MLIQKRIKIYYKGERTYKTILIDPNKHKYSQEERSMQDIVDDGDRDFLDFVGSTYSESLPLRSFKLTQRYDLLAEFF